MELWLRFRLSLYLHFYILIRQKLEKKHSKVETRKAMLFIALFMAYEPFAESCSCLSPYNTLPCSPFYGFHHAHTQQLSTLCIMA